MVDRRIITLFIAGLLVIAIILGQLDSRSLDDNPNNNGDIIATTTNTDLDPIINYIITFNVEIPARTPDLDAIVLHVGLNLREMNRINDTSYRLEIDPTEFDLGLGSWIDYGYSRGGFTPFAESLWISESE